MRVGVRARTDVRGLRGRMHGSGAKLLFALVALSIVLMHHVVAAHEHTGPDVARSATPAMQMVSAANPGGHGLVAHPGGEPGSSGPAMLHVHHEGGDHGASMLVHACLAVLAALAALLLLLVLISWRLGTGAGLLVRGALPEVPARGPPVPRRLAQLQVLRL